MDAREEDEEWAAHLAAADVLILKAQEYVATAEAAGTGLRATCDALLGTSKFILLSAGGTNGFSHIGIVCAADLLRPGWLLDEVEGAAGTSIGAFVALFVALRASVREILALMIWQNVLGINSLVELMRVFHQNGLIPLASVEQRIALCLERLGHPASLSFRQMEDSGARKFAAFGTLLGGTPATSAQTVCFSVRDFADMPVARAVAASMAVPLAIAPYYNGLQPFPIVDGGLSEPLPLSFFPLEESLMVCSMKTDLGLPVDHRLKDIVWHVFSLLMVDRLDFWIKAAPPAIQQRIVIGRFPFSSPTRVLAPAELEANFLGGVSSALFKWHGPALVRTFTEWWLQWPALWNRPSS